MDELVTIARIRKAHGVAGEVHADLLTFDPSRFEHLDRVFIRKSGSVQELHLEKFRPTAQGMLLKFSEVNDRNAAATLNGSEVCIPESERLPLPDNEAYLDEIIGMNVVDADTELPVGIVKGVHDYPAGVVYDIELSDASIRSVTTAGNEVISLSRKERTIRVRLLEEY